MLPAVVLGLQLSTAAWAQSHPPAAERPATPPAPTAESKTPAAARPTHAPRLELPPLTAFRHVRDGNTAFAAARERQTAPPAPAERPAGAGRYVCAAIVCACVDVDVPAALGLARRDVLLLSAPGPFVSPDDVALLERAVEEQRLSLIVVLGHAECATLSVRPGATPNQDALHRRIELARATALQERLPLLTSLVRAQGVRLLTASDLLRRHVATDALRILPGEIDGRSGAITWRHEHADEFALRPIR